MTDDPGEPRPVAETPTDPAPTVMILLPAADVRRVGRELRLCGGAYLSAARSLAAEHAATTACARRRRPPDPPHA